MIQTLYIIPSLIISSSFSPMNSQMRVASAVPYNDSVDKPSLTNSRRSVNNIVSSSCIRVAKILDTRDRKSWNLQEENTVNVGRLRESNLTSQEQWFRRTWDQRLLRPMAHR